MASDSVLGIRFLKLFLRDTILDFLTNVLLQLPKLLVIWEKIGEELQIVCKVVRTVHHQEYWR
jgi:hypothetical protein